MANIEETAGAEEECYVHFFKADKSQIRFEFFYLIVTLLAAVAAILLTHFKAQFMTPDSKALIYAGLGGFLGGWAFDAKWFYRVTARGRSKQYVYKWERNKFYWRVLTPFLSGLIAFTVYSLVTSEQLPLILKNPASGRASFGFSFVLGYFSDLVLTRTSKWLEGVLPSSGS
jgi:hypothetical protein